MPVEKLTPSFTFTEERLQALQAVVPEAFADGQVNWETLKAALEPFLEDEGSGTEHFGLFWPGKRQARRLAAQPSKGTLRPVKGQGVNEDTTHNLFIEGDNLEVLKLLQKSYAGRVKLIYIDPPYNTGNDFVYKDDFAEPLEGYLQRTGQADAEGLLTTNPKSSGRFHSNWLNMMLPRLILARTLLREDGVIFISIDDNELDNLLQIVNEVFGEENFVVNIPWQSRLSMQNDTDISVNHEYIIGYAKVRRQSNRRLKESNANQWYSLQSFAIYPQPLDANRFSNPDNDPRGPWKADPFDAPNVRPNLTYAIKNPNTKEEHWPPPGRCWRTEEENYKKFLADNRILFGKTGDARPQLKVFYNEKKDFGEVRSAWFDGATYGTTTSGTQELQSLFNGIAPFDKPKPSSIPKALLTLSIRNDDLVLDFFSGSSTTAQSVLELNREDGGNRRFIMVQMPEPTPLDSAARQAGYKTIADIGKERIRRVIAKLQKQPVLDRDPPEDLGFAVYQLDRSHFKAWQDYDGNDPAQLDDLFSRFEDPLIAGWTPRALLDEVLLLQGFPLDSRRTRLNDFPHNALVQVGCEWFSYRLFVCLDATLNPATIAALPLHLDDKFICLDSALTDQTKQQLADRCTLVVL